MTAYVHGYDPRERARLEEQARILADLLHSEIAYPEGGLVLEAGCGVGAQTITLARRSPGARIVSIDVNAASLREAAARVAATGVTNVEFQQADVFAAPFQRETFDHVFVCFVLEHLADPPAALEKLKELLKPGGTITVIEGDHGSTFFHPDDPAGRRVVDCLVALQRRSGGDSLIGRRLRPLLAEAGFAAPRVDPLVIYADADRPALAEGFTLNTFAAMIEGVRAPALAAGLIDAAAFDTGVAALKRAAEPDGAFFYAFFRGIAMKPV